MDLAESIRDLAKRGQMSHLSLTPRGKKWSASISPASAGNVFAEDEDPVTALLQACRELGARRRPPPRQASTAPIEEDDLSDLLG